MGPGPFPTEEKILQMLKNDNFDFLVAFGMGNMTQMQAKFVCPDIAHLPHLYLPSVRARHDQIITEREAHYQIVKQGVRHSISGVLTISFELAADPCDNNLIQTHCTFYGPSLLLRLPAEEMGTLMKIVSCGFDAAPARYGNGEGGLTVKLIHAFQEPFLAIYKTAPVLQVSEKILLSRLAYVLLRAIIMSELRFMDTLICTGRALRYIEATTIMKFVSEAMATCEHCINKDIDARIVRKIRDSDRTEAIDFLVRRHDCVKAEAQRSLEIGDAILTIFEQEKRLLIHDIDGEQIANMVQAKVTRRLRELNRSYLQGTVRIRR